MPAWGLRLAPKIIVILWLRETDLPGDWIDVAAVHFDILIIPIENYVCSFSWNIIVEEIILINVEYAYYVSTMQLSNK